VALSGGEGHHLRGPLRHKLGYAKPLGLGSCRVDIQKICYAAPPVERFSSLQGVTDTVLEGEELTQEVLRLTKPFAEDASVTMQQLRKMLVWDEGDQRTFRYPDFRWFQNSANSSKPLKTI
jgi:hypothetical protein